MDEVDRQALDAAWALVEARRAPAQLCVISRGAVVLDRCLRTGPDRLFWAFSAGKPVTSVIVWRLVERGLLDLDDPLCRRWPEFVGGGKEEITVRHVLQHRSGLPTAGSLLGDVFAMTDWETSIRRLERASCRYRPGSVPAYQFLSYGFLLGELVQRVTGQTFTELVQLEVCGPAGLADTYAHLVDALLPRAQLMVRRGGGAVVGSWVNRRDVREAVIPAGGISTTAHDLATFYAALLPDHAPGTLLAPATLAEATRPTTETELDRFARLHIRWAQGFQLGGPRPGRMPIPLGATSSPRAFGHNGSHVCLGWADPDRGLAVGYVTAAMTRADRDMAHMQQLSDAILAATRDRNHRQAPGRPS
ncbi:CubicO group peptidase, beta-lactamase class C family [Raineyella antarctica]|uniref:CubicO group peptidase, beta-lactamase class C family n=1 Tax=Raineyella antarctica TaxID=1577474 RepID=A0A1G6IGC9_9ACTN|nr:serine hydrolase domain-containing protein [Raineyella antarctica]SDC05612.1 CubicO group peptidase, beta-lactamase class C family [Raineyella antarctica]